MDPDHPPHTPGLTMIPKKEMVTQSAGTHFQILHSPPSGLGMHKGARWCSLFINPADILGFRRRVLQCDSQVQICKYKTKF